MNSVANVEANHAATELGTSESRAVQVLPAAEGYERWARTYDQNLNPLLAREERYLSPLLTNLRGRRVLDLACGTGRWLEKLVSRGCDSAVGIDCSAAMLETARKKAPIAGRLAFATCESLPFCSAAFDLVICSFAMGHVQDLHRMIHELMRVSKPGADVFVSDLHPDAYNRGWRVGFRDRGNAIQIEIFHRTTEQIVESFSASGFACVKRVSLSLGEPEHQIFGRAGKTSAFVEACQALAVFVCHFRRLTS